MPTTKMKILTSREPQFYLHLRKARVRCNARHKAEKLKDGKRTKIKKIFYLSIFAFAIWLARAGARTCSFFTTTRRFPAANIFLACFSPPQWDRSIQARETHHNKLTIVWSNHKLSDDNKKRHSRLKLIKQIRTTWRYGEATSQTITA